MDRINRDVNSWTRFCKVHVQDGRAVYGWFELKDLNPSDSDTIVRVGVSDTLWSLAHKYYSDVNLWWVIALANRIDLPEASLYSGLSLRIPAQAEVTKLLQRQL